jgi:hypothetical protein
MKEFVRCRPCGFVMEAGKLGDVCPACGLPRKVFEPYREKVSRNRLMLLNLDLHPIVIHLSQALVIAIPLLVILKSFFSTFQPEVIKNVLIFSVFISRHSPAPGKNNFQLHNPDPVNSYLFRCSQ